MIKTGPVIFRFVLLSITIHVVIGTSIFAQEKLSKLVRDGISWENGYPIANRTNFPLPFHRQLEPKPAFYSILDVSGP